LAIAAATGSRSGQPIQLADQQVTMRLNLADYDLARVGDRQRLQRRIDWAAGKVCRAAIPGAIQNELAACTKDVLADTRRQLEIIIAQRRAGSPMVAAISIAATVR
jgi:UrcA family protein